MERAIRAGEVADGDAVVPAFERLIGTLIANTYLIERFIGAGGMDAVFAGRDVVLEREVAIKVILPEIMTDRRAGLRLLKEAQITARLSNHPNIATVYAAHQEEGRFFIVQELLHGRTLRHDLVRYHFSNSPRQSLDRLIVTLGALDRAHQEGIIHRDVKPENVFVATSPGMPQRIVLLDFGISRDLLEPAARSRITQKSEAMGTAEYMSPEQAHNEPDIDARTDVFSAAMVGWEMLTYRRPWEGKTWASQLIAMTTMPLPDLRDECRYKIPDELAAVFHKALDRDRNKRYANAGEFLRALLAVDLELLFAQEPADRRRPTAREVERENELDAEARRMWEEGAPERAAQALAEGLAFLATMAEKYRLPAALVSALRQCHEASAFVLYIESERPEWFTIQVRLPPVALQATLLEAGFPKDLASHGSWFWFAENHPPYKVPGGNG